jgi:isocitrate dehydrogenase
MVIFRENTEDIYVGIEWEAGSAGRRRCSRFSQNSRICKRVRFPETSAIGIKLVSQEGPASGPGLGMPSPRSGRA